MVDGGAAVAEILLRLELEFEGGGNSGDRGGGGGRDGGGMFSAPASHRARRESHAAAAHPAPKQGLSSPTVWF